MRLGAPQKADGSRLRQGFGEPTGRQSEVSNEKRARFSAADER